MKIWKRNAVIATVLLFICAGVYLNWSYNNRQKTPDLTDTLNAEQVMGEATLQLEDAAEPVSLDTSAGSTDDYFAQMRLSRQSSRDSAVELLEQTIAYDEGTAVGDTASQTLNHCRRGAQRGADREPDHRQRLYRLCDLHGGRHRECCGFCPGRRAFDRRCGAHFGRCDLADGL